MLIMSAASNILIPCICGSVLCRTSIIQTCEKRQRCTFQLRILFDQIASEINKKVNRIIAAVSSR
jgi:hypothetical protein